MKKLLPILLLTVTLSASSQVELISGGSGNAYTLAYPGVFSYTNGISVTFIASFANTGPATININNEGAKAMTKQTTVSLAAGDILNGQMVILIYDGTNFQVVSVLGSSGSSGSLPSGTYGQTLYNNGGGGYTASSLLYNNTASIGINNTAPNASAALDVQSGSQGVLLPRMNTSQRNSISSPAAGLMIYNTDDSCFNYYSGAAWIDDCGTEPITSTSPLNGSCAGGAGTSVGYAVTTDASGYSYTTGNYSGTITIGSNTLTGGNIFIAKYDPNGNVVWAQSATGGVSYAIGVDGSGDVYIGGSGSSTGGTFGTATFTNVSGSGANMFVAKYNAGGTAQWVKNAGIGTSGAAAVYALTCDAYGNVWITGGMTSSSGGALTFPGSSVSVNYPKYFVASLTSSGTVAWAEGPTSYIGANTNLYTFGIVYDGVSVYISGYTASQTTFFSGSSLSNCTFIAKYSASSPGGVFQWVLNADSLNTYGGYAPFTTSSSANNIPLVYSNGVLYIAGTFSTSTILGTSVQINTPAGSQGTSMYIAEFDTAANFLNAMADGYATSTSLPVYPEAMTVDASGNIYVSGAFGYAGPGSAGSTFSVSGQTLICLGYTDVFVAKYGSGFTPVWAISGGGSGADYGFGVAVDPSLNIFNTGYFTGTANFNGKTFSGAGGSTYYVVKYRATGNTTQSNSTLSATQQSVTPNISYSGSTLSVSDGNSITMPWGENGNIVYTTGAAVGINTQTPESPFEVDGAFATELSKKTTSATLDNTATVWYFQPTAAITVTLPAAGTCTNRRYVIVNTSTFAATISPTFYNLTHTLTGTGPISGSVELISDGTNWLQMK